MTRRTWFGKHRPTIERLIVAVLVGTIVHAVACIIKRPLEFGNGSRLHTFFCAFVSGLLSFPVVFAALLLPLRAVLRRCIPHATKWTQATIAPLAILLLIWAWILMRLLSGVELPAFCHGYFWHTLFWTIFVIAVVLSFFWPLNRPNVDARVRGE